MDWDEAVRKACRGLQLAAGMALLASWFGPGPVMAQTREGRSTVPVNAPNVIFRRHCSVCHGENGDGQSFARFALDPKPKDFTSEKSQKELSRAHMIEVLNKGVFTKDGKPTAMISRKSQLSPQQIEAVVDYIIVTFMKGKLASNQDLHAEGLEHRGHDHSAIKDVDYPYGLKPNAANGQSLYASNCGKCHGEKGDGRGTAVRVGSSKPRNFGDPDFQAFANGFTLYSAVMRGTGHMPAWDKILSPQEIADVSEYILHTYVKKPHTHSH